MTLEQADSITEAYQNLLNEEGMRGARRSPSLLPAPKVEIVRALRMQVARLYYQGLDDEDALRPLFQAAMFLDGFTNDALDSQRFLQSMQERRRELMEFHQELFDIGRHDNFFWQRVYALLGISSETKRTTVFEQIKERLGRVVRSERSRAEVRS